VRHGFAAIENDLLVSPNAMMVFGDAKKALTSLSFAIKANRRGSAVALNDAEALRRLDDAAQAADSSANAASSIYRVRVPRRSAP